MGTDLLITVNVPYPDEDAAASPKASAECFLWTTTGVAVSEASPVGAQAPVVADGAFASEGASASNAATDVSQEAQRAGEAPTGEAVVGGDGAVGAPEELAREAASTRAAAEGGEDGRQLSSSARDNDFDAGVTALRPLLHSFSILDWSLFG